MASRRQETHRAIDPRFSGRVVELRERAARVELTATPEMRADDRGLVHGGFLFSLADHAAMLAVNHPNVVLSAAEVRFLKPVVVGDRLTAEARWLRQENRRDVVEVIVKRGEEAVLVGEMVCASPRRHVLEPAGRRAAPAGGG